MKNEKLTQIIWRVWAGLCMKVREKKLSAAQKADAKPSPQARCNNSVFEGDIKGAASDLAPKGFL